MQQQPGWAGIIISNLLLVVAWLCSMALQCLFKPKRLVNEFFRFSCSEGGFFNARLTFPKDYPNSPPTCRFTSEMWHPNGEHQLLGCSEPFHHAFLSCAFMQQGLGCLEGLACRVAATAAAHGDDEAHWGGGSPLHLSFLPLQPYTLLCLYNTYPLMPFLQAVAWRFWDLHLIYVWQLQQYNCDYLTLLLCYIFACAVYADGRVCISILHNPGDDPNGYETAAERWSPVQSVSSSGVRLLAQHTCWYSTRAAVHLCITSSSFCPSAI
jgi:hypothetical protein